VPQMIEIIQGLLDKGIAYVVDGEVYYSVARFPKYGELSGNLANELIDGASERVASEVIERKRNPRDFALWKVDAHHMQQWDAPWGRGFPGWHIECSAMSRRFLGDTLDIHTGGENNIFPHHECEIAQSEGFTNQTFVRTWLHTAHLNLEGDKMAKSDGNVLLPSQLVEEGFSPTAIRYYLMSVHYRQPMNFTREALRGAATEVKRLLNLAGEMGHRAEHGPSPAESHESVAVIETLDESRARFVSALDDDLNISEARAVLFDTMRKLNAQELNKHDAMSALGFLQEVDQVFGVLPATADSLDAVIEKKITERESARTNRDFATADRIRDELLADGIELMDTPDGMRWRRT